MSGLSVTARSFIMHAAKIQSFEFGGKHDRLEPTTEALEGMLRMVEHGVFELDTVNAKNGAIRLVRGEGKVPKSEFTYDGRELYEFLGAAPHTMWHMRQKGERPMTVSTFRELLEERAQDFESAPAPAP